MLRQRRHNIVVVQSPGGKVLFRTTISLLGAPRIERDGVPVEVDTRKATALAAYLAVTRRGHTRDALAGLLWPEYNQGRARAALRRTLSSLGKAREEGWLLADRESVDLDHNAIRVDVVRFDDLLAQCRLHGHPESEVCTECLPPLTEAVELYRDDFMAGFGLRDSVAFDDWQFFQSESLRRELAGALERLARGRAALGEWEAAVAHARRWLSLDVLHEPAHRLLMMLYAWSDERAAALRQYRECVRVLDQELGVAPLEETTLLYRAIQENDLPPRPALSEYEPAVARDVELTRVTPVDSSTAAPRSQDTSLVGRDHEWEALLEAYASIGDGGRVVVIEGEIGIGKTRLAEEFVAHVRERGATAIVARCYAGEKNLAYGPFVEGLSAALGRESGGRLKDLPDVSLQEAARLLPDLSPDSQPAPPLDTPGARSRFFAEVVRVLLEILDGPPPGVLFFDDLQWADDASLSLLNYLIRRLGDKPLCVLLTWRTEDVPEGHRLRELLAETRRSGAATALTLERLGPESVDELVGNVVPDAAMLGPRLSDETEGLPLFLAEYLAAVEKGELDPGDDAWTLPGGVQDLLKARLGTVGETAGQILAAAAVVGRSFDFDTVRAASGRGEEETLDALEELISRGLIREVGAAGVTPSYDFDHDKLRTLVYEETSLARKRLLHRRTAAALSGQTRGRESEALAGQIARHHRLAGQDVEAARSFRLAGDYARSLHANTEALSHYEEALALGHPDTATLHEAIGDLRTRTGEYGAALASYEAAASSAGPEELAAIEHKIGNVHARRGERDLARLHYESALDEFSRTIREVDLARLYADWSLLSHGQDEPEEATAFARRALELAEGTGDTRALAQAHNMLGILAGKSGDQQASLRHLAESLDLAEALGDSDAQVAALNNLALARESGGEPEEALKLAELALKLCVASGDRHREAALHNNLADLFHATGREQESMEHLKRAVELFAEIGERDELQPEVWKLVEW
jgi:predicted ATPase/DNA-binding SARP family transcriptional activator